MVNSKRARNKITGLDLTSCLLIRVWGAVMLAFLANKRNMNKCSDQQTRVSGLSANHFVNWTVSIQPFLN